MGPEGLETGMRYVLAKCALGRNLVTGRFSKFDKINIETDCCSYSFPMPFIQVPQIYCVTQQRPMTPVACRDR